MRLKTKSFERYKGDFDYYLREREIRFEHSSKNYESQQRFIKKQEVFIQKNLVRASTTKQAQSVRKKLEKLDVVEKPVKQKKLTFHFPFSTQTGRDVLVIDDLLIGYSKPLLSPLSTVIKKQQKSGYYR